MENEDVVIESESEPELENMEGEFMGLFEKVTLATCSISYHIQGWKISAFRLISAFFKFYRPILWIVQNRWFFLRKSVGVLLSAACNTFIIFIEPYIVRVMRHRIQARKQASARPHLMNHYIQASIWSPPIQAYTHILLCFVFMHFKLLTVCKRL